METIYQSKYLTIHHEPENELIHSQWNTKTFDAIEEDIKKELLCYTSYIHQYQPKRILANTQNFLFIVPVEMQPWVAKKFLSAANNCVQRYAYIKPQEFVVQLSLEQSNDELTVVHFEVHFFDHESEARQWLLS